MSTVPGKDNPADIGTKYEKGDDVQSFSQWINFKGEEASEDATEKRRSETKTIVGTMGGSILTAASVASAKADTDITSTCTVWKLVENDMTETESGYFLRTCATIFATGVASGAVLGI